MYLDYDFVTDYESVAIATVTLEKNGERYRTVGVARKTDGDEWNTEVAEDLALGRALRQIGRNLLHDGNLLVREADKRQQKQKAASEAAMAAKEERRKSKEAERELVWRGGPSFQGHLAPTYDPRVYQPISLIR